MLSFRILGPLEVRVPEGLVAISGRHHPRLLAMLLDEPNQAVPTEKLAAGLWDDRPPSTAARQVQNIAAALRRQLGPAGERLRKIGSDYQIDVEADELDVLRCRQNEAAAIELRTAGRLVEAESALGEALAEWRGPSLGGPHRDRRRASRTAARRLPARTDRSAPRDRTAPRPTRAERERTQTCAPGTPLPPAPRRVAHARALPLRPEPGSPPRLRRPPRPPGRRTRGRPRADAQLALYRSVIGGKRRLLILDNARDAAQVRPLLPDASQAHTVVISRRRLVGLAVAHGATAVEISAFDPIESRALLERPASRPDFWWGTYGF